MDHKTLLIVGAKGQLGQALQQVYPQAQAVNSAELDITDWRAVSQFDWSGISTILNAAAYTNVDGAETAVGRVAAWQVNAVGPANLARVANLHSLTLVHVSTDYVFDGTKTNHPEDEPFSPLSVYGQSKAAGDIAVSLTPKHYILRTSWVIGEGQNFVRTMLGLGQKGVSPSVVADQIGRLTFTTDLSAVIDHLLQTQATPGTYNATNSGDPASWANITRQIFQLAGLTNTVTDTTTAKYFQNKPEAARRPLHSTLDLTKLQATGFTPRDWQTALKDYLQKEQV